MNYEKTATKPKWYESDNNKIYACATSGSSPFNEWYEFDDRGEALEYIARHFDSQTFIDNFVWFNGEVYEYDQFEVKSIAEADNVSGYVLLDEAEVASIAEMVEAESRF